MQTSTPYKRAETIEGTFVVDKSMGSGAFSSVFEATNKQTGRKCALKVMDKKVFVGPAKRFLVRECQLMAKASHPNLVGLYSVLETPKQICLEMEKVNGGDLWTYLKNTQRPLSESEAAALMHKLMTAVAYLHGNRIAHRDIKIENILLEGGNVRAAKLCDFGLAVEVAEGGEDDLVACTPCGSAGYFPPELLQSVLIRGSTPAQTNLTGMLAVDSWQLGVLLYFVLSGRFPYGTKMQNNPDRTEAVAKMKAGPNFSASCWKRISPAARELVEGLLTFDPQSRMTVQKGLESAWMQEHASTGVTVTVGPAALAPTSGKRSPVCSEGRPNSSGSNKKSWAHRARDSCASLRTALNKQTSKVAPVKYDAPAAPVAG
eukprot:NODE_1076_length_1480_cov_166.787879_g1065_i0.p1 GENE.NODE_1076_length_1480_cov_166.787879_g1065_i0~~NODE_1076_length_1480_cov_166.787879_g1065_i0.p1  ORF type:complete len:374 (+),score=85.87 NODE_1076_length_1480_cov_166.787879_g1065_i0:75-1196(+)